MLENELNGKRFFGGENIGLVDIVGSFIALWLGVMQEIMEIEVLTSDKLPKLTEWADNYLKSAVIKQSLPPRDELSARVRGFFRPSK